MFLFLPSVAAGYAQIPATLRSPTISEASARSTATFVSMLHFARNRLNNGTRSFAPATVLFVQLAVVVFAMLGANQIMILGSEGVAKPNTLVKLTLPQVQEGSLWRFNDYCDYLVVGWPLDGSKEPRMLLGDQFVDLEDLWPYVRASHDSRCERLRPKGTMVIYADARMPMEVITAVKQELRKANQLRVCYAVTPVP